MSDDKILEDSRMVHKANQIAAYFVHYPRDRAVEGVADHIQKFWSPPMRTQLKTYLKDNAHDLHELVVEAAEKI